jgi:SAM-dependent methyltransferase
MTRQPLLTDWDARYARSGFTYGTEPNHFLADVVSHLPLGRALSLGEGEGRNAVFLAGRGWAVTGVDRSRVGLRKASALAAERGLPLSLCVADLAAFPLPPDRYDVILSIFCHLPASVRCAVHRSVVRGLRQGGAYVFEAYTPRQLEFRTGGPSTRELLVTLDELRTELAGLDFAVGRELERDVIEGDMHRGRSAVVQVLAFRRDNP